MSPEPVKPRGFIARFFSYLLHREYLQFPERVGAKGLIWTQALGRIGLLLIESLRVMFLPPFRWRLYTKQLEFIGNRSLTVILLTGFAVGAILTLQLTATLTQFSSENMVGGIVALVMAKELGPLLGGLMINGRVASAIAAEIGAMRVSEQIDALEAMSVDSVQYLISPRLFAGALILPFMTLILNMVAMLASYMVAVHLLGLDAGMFFSKISDLVQMEDLFEGLAKSVAFGFILTFVGCYKGFFTRGGAQGVGLATTQAVVVGSVLIMLSDYFIGSFMLDWP